MEVYKQFMIWLTLLFIIGTFLNLVVAPFVNIDDYTSTNAQNDLINSINGDNSSNFITTNTATTFIGEQIDLFNLIPSYITIPFFIIGIILLILTLLNLIPFVG